MRRSDQGFTLIEALVTVAIVAIIAGFGTTNFLNLRNEQVLRNQVETLVSDVRETSGRSRAQEGGLQWGIHLENLEVGDDFYEIWSGESYASGTVVERVTLGTGLDFLDPISSSTRDIIFLKATGLPTASSTIVITSLRTSDVGILTVGNQGSVSSQIVDVVSGPPTVTTDDVGPVSTSTALLNGRANPNGSSTVAWFRYDTVSPGVCDDIFGIQTATTSIGSGTTSAPFPNGMISGLSASTTYYYCAIAENPSGKNFGGIAQFTTDAPPVAPEVTTNAATGVTTSTATLNAFMNPLGFDTDVWFRYTTSAPWFCADSPVFGPATTPTSEGSASGSQSVNHVLPGLQDLTQHWFCVVAENAGGKSLGSVLDFTTNNPPTPPSVTTESASNFGTSSATLHSTINPNGSSTDAWYRYDIVNPGTCNNTFGTQTATTSIGSGTSGLPNPIGLIGLTNETTYYYCAIAESVGGMNFGTVLQFMTTSAADPPSVVTNDASGITTSTALLNAIVNPNGIATDVWFRHSATDPGDCDEFFGTPTTATSVGSGSSGVSVNQLTTGLPLWADRYYCALAQNASGISTGTVVQFKTKLTVICSELYNQGYIDDVTIEGDRAYGAFKYETDPYLIRGYHVWARPFVTLMQKYPAFTKRVAFLGQAWARQMSYEMGYGEEGSELGRVMKFIGEPITRAIGYADAGLSELKARNIARD